MKSVKRFIFLPLLILVLLFASCNGDDGGGGTENPPKPGPTDPSEYVYDTPETKKLKLTAEYEGKDFITDGIGVASVQRYVDGDTTMFNVSDTSITVRYLGINTPESTYRIEPWGFEASKVNKKLFKDCLDAGGKVVLQADPSSGRTDSNGRYLAWVWLISADGDSKLLNLEIAELAYSQVKCDTNALYYTNLLAASQPLVAAKVRVYGEKDPSYDYNKEGIQMSIKEVRETYGTPDQIEAYSKGGETTSTSGELIVSGAGTLVVISGTVVRKNGEKNAYIQQYDESTGKYYGIYVYGGYNAISKLIVGANVEITAKIGYYYGSLQLTDLTSDRRIKLYNLNGDVNSYEEMEASDVNDINKYSQIGRLVKISNLTVTGYSDADNTNAITINTSYTDAYGKSGRLDIRVDSGVVLFDPEGKQIKSGSYFVGKKIESIIGIIGYYNWESSNITYSKGRIQIMLTSMDDIVFSEQN